MTSIVHLSDLHFGEAGARGEEELLHAVASLEPDLVAISGDLTHAGRAREFAEAARFVRRLPAPWLAVPGNHDVPAHNLLERFFFPTRRFRRFMGPTRTPVHVSEGLRALGLNTARPWDLSWNWSHGRLSRRQIRVIGRALAGSPTDGARILVVHHPFFVPDRMPAFRAIANGSAALAALVAARVEIVLAGHLHRGFWKVHRAAMEGGARSVLVVQASTALSGRTRDEPNAFNHLRIDGDSLRLTPWLRNDSGFAPASPSRFVRTPAGWSPAAEAAQAGR